MNIDTDEAMNRHYIPDGVEYSGQHNMAVTQDWLQGWDACKELADAFPAPQPAECEPVATVTISHFRGSKAMENRDFDYFGELPEGTHRLFPAPQPCPKCEWHVEEAKIAKAEINRLSAIKYKHFSGADCWIYQGDGEDHLDSLVCPVVIAPKQLLELQAKVSELEKDRTFHNHHVTPQVHADLMLIEKAKLEGTSNNSHLYPELKIQFLEAKLTRAEELIDAGREAIIHMCNTLTATSTSKYDGVYVSGVLKAITEYREGVK